LEFINFEESVYLIFFTFNYMAMNENLFQQIKLIFALFFAILLVVFAVQNAQEVEIRFWFWQFSASLSLVLLISIGIGVMLSILFTTFAIRKKNIKKKAEEAERKLESQKIENTEDI
jgi:lipopolysaccharide assembly protein A